MFEFMNLIKHGSAFQILSNRDFRRYGTRHDNEPAKSNIEKSAAFLAAAGMPKNAGLAEAAGKLGVKKIRPIYGGERTGRLSICVVVQIASCRPAIQAAGIAGLVRRGAFMYVAKNCLPDSGIWEMFLITTIRT